jgi:hypothetical protein
MAPASATNSRDPPVQPRQHHIQSALVSPTGRGTRDHHLKKTGPKQPSPGPVSNSLAGLQVQLTDQQANLSFHSVLHRSLGVVEEEAPVVSLLFDGLGDGLAGTVARIRSDTNQDGVFTLVGLLQTGQRT